jgi:hypothetical protein
MARELQAFGPIGAAAYGLLFHDGFGLVWNNTSHAFETPAAANWASYALPFTEQGGTGIFFGDMPAGLARGTYAYIVRKQLGTTPVPTDGWLDQGSIEWSGSATVSLATQLDAAVSTRMVTFTPPQTDSSGFAIVAPTGLNQVMIAGITLPQAIRYIAAVVNGRVSGAGSGVEQFFDYAGTPSVQVFVDSSGNRNNVLLN